MSEGDGRWRLDLDGGDVLRADHVVLAVPARAAAALENYSGVDLPEEFLINRDSKPLTHLYSLFLTAKQSGAPASKLIKHLVLAGPLVFLVPVFVFLVLRVIYLLKPAQQIFYLICDKQYIWF